MFGKVVLVRHEYANGEQFVKITDVKVFTQWLTDGLISFAILSDEQQVCEYRICEDGSRSVDQHNGNLHSLDENYCSECGLPIHIVDELKPLPLMGIEPTIVQIGNLGWKVNYESYEQIHILFWYQSDREAIESWNSLVERLTKKTTGENHG
jgi:hypothetical protein